ncbi:arylsulfatase I-like isoform X2 [Oratosquilla oratoria]|uniref:arylsulfatase I-like isoform X2 n=1 Tax=Oratosquilla oratoria TaxID=337810 RepID=UPI003F77466A
MARSALTEAALILVAAFASSLSSSSHYDGVMAAEVKPHNIVFILGDDIGWNEVPWNNPEVLMPNLYSLYNSSVQLPQYYAHPICSPSRAALLTGLYSHKTGRQRFVLVESEPTGLTLNHTLLPQKLKDLGYATHLVGKWHLGFCDVAYTPLHRGYDTHYGFYAYGEHYYTHETMGNESPIGFDFRDQDRVAWETKGSYSEFLFAERTEHLLLNAKVEGKPFFLQLASQNIHYPLEVPKIYEDLYPDNDFLIDKLRYAMLSALDDTIGKVVRTLKEEGLYDNTVIVFSSDNGAELGDLHGNLPLRGFKWSSFEGGTRVPAFIHSPLLGLEPRVHKGLFHITDWFNTILDIAMEGEEMSADELHHNDGFSQWSALKSGAPSPRTHLIYNLDIVNEKPKGAIRRDNFKYVTGELGSSDIGRHGPWLFNLDVDPNEKKNLMDEEPEVAADMEKELHQYLKDVITSDVPLGDSSGDPDNFGGAWSPGWCTAT